MATDRRPQPDTLCQTGADGVPSNDALHAELLADGDSRIDMDLERRKAIAKGMPKDVAARLFQPFDKRQ